MPAPVAAAAARTAAGASAAPAAAGGAATRSTAPSPLSGVFGRSGGSRPGRGRKGRAGRARAAVRRTTSSVGGVTSSVTLTPPKRLSGGDVGGFLVGLLGYTLALSYIRYGPEGPKAWIKAKFINEPTSVGDLTGAGKQWGRSTIEPEDRGPRTSAGLTTTRPNVAST